MVVYPLASRSLRGGDSGLGDFREGARGIWGSRGPSVSPVSKEVTTWKRHFWSILGASLWAWSGGMAPAAEVEAKKDGVEIFSNSTRKSSVIGKLQAGETLETTERKGMFWQVTMKDGATGYVSILMVKHRPDKNANLVKAINGVVRGDRVEDDATQARTRSAVMGVRGLREDDDMAQAAAVRPNIKAVYGMEDIRISDKRIEELGDKVMGEIARKAEGKK